MTEPVIEIATAVVRFYGSMRKNHPLTEFEHMNYEAASNFLAETFRAYTRSVTQQPKQIEE